MAKVALEVKGLPADVQIWIEGPDITERDNATLALALGRAYPNLSDMLDREAIDDKEFMRLVYKTFAEVWDDSKVPTIKCKPLTKPSAGNDSSPTGKAIEDTKSDPGDPKESANQAKAEHYLKLIADAVDAIGNDRVIDILEEMRLK